MNYVSPSMFKDGFEVNLGSLKLDILPYIFFGTFISLAWLWLMPNIGTIGFLRGGFDAPRYTYMYKLGLYRFFFLVTDDPRVTSKERSGACS